MAVDYSHIKATGRGTVLQQARLWSGLIILVYVTGHFINHSLGLISLEAMDTMLAGMSFIWGTIAGTIVLYGAFGVHILLGIWTIINIRTFRMPLWRWIQILLGVAIPYWLISHVLITKGSELATGVPVTYLQEFAFLWPVAAIKQNALLIIVWTHGFLGVHFWLRPQAWYREWGILMHIVAIIIPILAIVGWITAAQRELLRVRTEPTGQAEANLQQVMDAARGSIAHITPLAQTAVLILLGATVVLFLTLHVARRLRRTVKVSYGKELVLEATPGKTLLDVSREAGISHMSVCGGRARCSTCRVMVVSDQGGLSRIGPAERKLLDKIDAEPNMRLACQARVLRDTEIRPIIQPALNSAKPLNTDPFGWGDEREVAILFLNIRDFTTIANTSLAYDTVFVLNHFFDLMVAEIEAAGGYVDKFVGDGLMAIFGLETTPKIASRNALLAAANCHQLAKKPDTLITQHLNQPIDVSIGVHTGKVIIGRVGKTSDQTAPSRITALGETVTIASTLERVTKKVDANIIYSRATHDYAELGMAEMIGETAKVKVNKSKNLIESIIIKNSKILKNSVERQPVTTLPAAPEVRLRA